MTDPSRSEEQYRSLALRFAIDSGGGWEVVARAQVFLEHLRIRTSPPLLFERALARAIESATHASAEELVACALDIERFLNGNAPEFQNDEAVRPPQWRSRDTVLADKIIDVSAAVEQAIDGAVPVLVLHLECGATVVPAGQDSTFRSKWPIGGYYVRWSDGEERWWTAEKFETAFAKNAG